jgi:hypothetical protein
VFEPARFSEDILAQNTQVILGGGNIGFDSFGYLPQSFGFVDVGLSCLQDSVLSVGSLGEHLKN